MDFLKVGVKSTKKDQIDIFPKFIVKKSTDLMVRGGDFYAIWDERKGLWSTDQDDVIDLVDAELINYKEEHKDLVNPRMLFMWDSDSGTIDKWHKYVQKQLPDSYHPLDEKLVFENSPVKKKDYASKRLPYSLIDGDISAWDELVGTLYSPEERRKIEWAIGSVVSGDSRKIQKFFVFYGAAGTGKSTILNIIQQLFQGYYVAFDAKALGSNNAAFALEPFKSNPLVAIQHDGDLSRIEDNTRLNSIVSHELMTVNEKFKSQYVMKFNTMLFMGTNRPVKITDSKSGILRRLIDISPSEQKIPQRRYYQLMNQISFELGAIAKHCLDVYEENKNIYDVYTPTRMMVATNDMYNFVEEILFDKGEDEINLTDAWTLYKAYCEDSNVGYPLIKRSFKEELKGYYDEYYDRTKDSNGKNVYCYYKGLKISKFMPEEQEEYKRPDRWLVFKEQDSIFDDIGKDYRAQYASRKETPINKWDDVKTTLSEIDTSKLHYVQVPENHIVIDFDLKNDDGEKSYRKNLNAAEKWPKTYAELSKSGEGIHLHYIYDGDVTRLSRIYDENIEVKVFNGNSSLRRKLSKCNDIPITHINSGLPMKEDKVVNFEVVKSEKQLRGRIEKCLRKEHHGATAPEVDFICHILDEAYESGLEYDLSDMYPKILAFANNSTHQAPKCLKTVSKMHFQSDEPIDVKEIVNEEYKSDIPVFFDIESFPNFFGIAWKFMDDDHITKLYNPSPKQVAELLNYKLIGFNNRRYDNHILYARMQGYSVEELFKLSQRIVDKGDKNAFFREAYNISYTDVYDFASAGNKKSLKKWEIELGIHHQELGLKWNEPVKEELWPLVMDYCANDVIATEAVFKHLSSDFEARKILADITGLSVNTSTNQLTTKLIVGTDQKPQNKFVYTDLSEMFPGYKYEAGVSTYRDEIVGEGGYVYAEPGIYTDVALLDIASMHPSSAIALNVFGPYTKNFKDLVYTRLDIKHGNYEEASKLFDGKLAPYLKDKSKAKALSGALKTAINSVYGLTAAKFDNKLRDPRNVDNIVAKRGALFMIDLKHAVQEKGYVVAHIKTDSIKIPNADEEIIKFVCEFGEKYGYTFEQEAIYEKMCLVNDAVYIAKEKGGSWTATGTQFQVPYVFKTLFSKEPIKFEDMCETKSVTTSIYLDMNENLEDDEHEYRFVGKVGLFCPIKNNCGGGLLMREKDGKYYSVTGTKGFRWLEAEAVQTNKKEEDIDTTYYTSLVDDAIATISKFGDVEQFIS